MAWKPTSTTASIRAIVTRSSARMVHQDHINGPASAYLGRRKRRRWLFMATAAIRYCRDIAVPGPVVARRRGDRRTRSGGDWLLPLCRRPRAAASSHPCPLAPMPPIPVAPYPRPHAILMPLPSRLHLASSCACVPVPQSSRQSPRSHAPAFLSPRPAPPLPPRPRLIAHVRASRGPQHRQGGQGTPSRHSRPGKLICSD